MAVYNYDGEEINVKVVYYGPGLGGKTTNLEQIHACLPRENKGKMVSMKTRTDRTLFFDFLPIEVGDVNGYTVRFLLYTVPGQVYYNATRKLVLKGVDALVFVADSSKERLQDNKESLQNLEDNLNELGMTLREMPWIIQYNKRDLADAMPREVLDSELNIWNAPSFEATAVDGSGVYETFEGIAGQVLGAMRRDLGAERRETVHEQRNGQPIDVEIVAKGRSIAGDSETDEGESLKNAEKREEEHESVSEFVDSVLQEEGGEDSIDLGATRGGYEDYGHVVELADDAASSPAAWEPPQGGEIISDPLEHFSDEAAPVEEAAIPEPAPRPAAAPVRTIRVPVTISGDEVGSSVPIEIVLEVRIAEPTT